MSGAPAGGLRLTGQPRSGDCGQWIRATTAEGRRRGVLLLDPALVAPPGALDRAVGAVAAVRRLNLPGVLRMADLISHADRVWLITEVPAAPTVAELIAAGGLDPAAIALLAADTGQSLERLHQAGLAHGALGPDTVVVTAAGEGSLIEVGLAAALRGDPPDPAADAAAWAALIRALAAAVPDATGAQLLGRVAAEAESAGLAPGLRTLAGGAEALPEFPSRNRLVAAVASAAGPASPAEQAGPPAQRAPGAAASGTPPGELPPAGAGSRTLLPGAGPAPVGAGDAADPAEQRTRLGRRADRSYPPDSAGGPGGDRPAEVNLRFGPGVAGTAAEQVWRGATRTPAKRRRPVLRAVLRGLVSGLVTLALIAGVAGFLWWRQRDSLVVTAAAVTTAQPPGSACDVTVDVVGTVQTNGRAGTLRYQWVRSDGQVSAVLDQTVAEGARSARVHLYWSFSGKGSYQARATLKILEPTPLESSATFTYACR